jgi:hypothetical protein
MNFDIVAAVALCRYYVTIPYSCMTVFPLNRGTRMLTYTSLAYEKGMQ